MHLETVTRAGLLVVWAGFSVCSYAGAEAFTQGRGGSSLLARATLLTTTQMLIGAAIFIINTAMDSKVNQLTVQTLVMISNDEYCISLGPAGSWSGLCLTISFCNVCTT